MLIQNISEKPIGIVSIDRQRVQLEPGQVAQVSDVVGRGYLNNYGQKFKLYENASDDKVVTKVVTKIDKPVRVLPKPKKRVIKRKPKVLKTK